MQSTRLVSRGGRPSGLVSTHRGRPHRPSEEDFRLFDVLARQAADAIERAGTQAAERMCQPCSAGMMHEHTRAHQGQASPRHASDRRVASAAKTEGEARAGLAF